MNRSPDHNPELHSQLSSDIEEYKSTAPEAIRILVRPLQPIPPREVFTSDAIDSATRRSLSPDVTNTTAVHNPELSLVDDNRAGTPSPRLPRLPQNEELAANSRITTMPPAPPSSIPTMSLQPHYHEQKANSQAASSYWSVAEANNFPLLLRAFGTDWSAIAKHMQTKTTVMVCSSLNYRER